MKPKTKQRIIRWGTPIIVLALSYFAKQESGPILSSVVWLIYIVYLKTRDEIHRIEVNHAQAMVEILKMSMAEQEETLKHIEEVRSYIAQKKGGGA